MSKRNAYFAGGCFWGIEQYFRGLDGVLSTAVGYAQSNIENPSYEQVCAGESDAAEAIHIVYDDEVTTLRTLALMLVDIIDPFSVNKQGGDEGLQYRSAFFYETEEERMVYEDVCTNLERLYGRTPAVIVEPLTNFYSAEEYHQDYLVKNPDGYCHIPGRSIETAKNRQQFIERIYALDPEQFAVTQKEHTEAPHENAYDQEFRPGIYVDIVSGKPLFSSKDKYDAGCGWPAFTKPLEEESIATKRDFTIITRPRIEIHTADASTHLGHVFNDGPEDAGGRRFCVNSAAVRFIPVEEMEAQGYGEYLSQFDSE
ncbi:MAG: peptide-methionine (R)-S-oxide reductase MsrB [Corynebacterium sp.]|nr:peptide-methionine (R)-S-oxide reductase MsrB [Corynebacterium sp.]